MTRPLSLEDFGRSSAQLPDGQSGDALIEEDRLSVYEAGYQSGWDDCIAGEQEARRRISADFATNLQDISVAYDKARADILAGLGPLFEDIAGQLLPALAAQAVAPVVADELRKAAEIASTGEITLLAAPAVIPTLERMIEAEDSANISLTPEPAFAEGQVSIRYQSERRDVDLGAAAERMSDALRAFIASDTAHSQTWQAVGGHP